MAPDLIRPGRLVVASVVAPLLVLVVVAVLLASRGGESGAASVVVGRGDRPAAADPTPYDEGSAPPAAVAGPAPSHVRPRRPTSVLLPDGARMPVDVAGTSPAGALIVPDDIAHAGWWEGGSRLGDRFGSLLLAAHVDSRTQGIGPVATLLDARVGDPLVVRAGAREQRFLVSSRTRVPRDELRRHDDLFSARGPLRLVFLTCGGPFDPARGYRDNVVVVARPDTAP